MKVGTDAVLIGAWANVADDKTILEIGTGCGVIALMLAQKNLNSQVIGIDIDFNSIMEASQNFKNSLWSDRVEAFHQKIQSYSHPSGLLFDHLVCNPPFFENSLASPISSRNKARHLVDLSIEDLFSSADRLLTTKGKISIIIPYETSKNWLSSANQFGFNASRITEIYSYPTKPIERLLIEFSRENCELNRQSFYIREGKGQGYTLDYKNLTGDFYLS